MKNNSYSWSVFATVSIFSVFAYGVDVSSVDELRSALADDTVTEIAIAHGTYELTEQIQVSRAVIVTGDVSAPEKVILTNTVADARVLYLNNASAIVQGVTLTGGHLTTRGNDGAGANIQSGTLANSRIIGNKVTGSMIFGSGIYFANNANAVLRDSLVAENQHLGSGGVGVVYCNGKNTSAKVIRCEIANNTATGGSNVGTAVVGTTISDSSIHHNNANHPQDFYGGLWGYGAGGVAHGVVYRCRIYENTADIPSGALAASALRNCTVYDSLIVSNGGTADKAAIINCTLYGCTVAGNRCNTADGWLVSGTCKFYNCIVWKNLGGEDGTEERVDEAENAAFNNCCLGIDPLFNTSLPFPNNWTFPVESPCYNTGDNSLVQSASTADLFGNARVFARKVDIGCIEIVPATAAGELSLVRATFDGAEFDITVDCLGTDAQSTDVVIEYSSSSDFSDAVTVSAGTVSGELPQTLRATLSGLDHGSAYYIRARFTNTNNDISHSHPLLVETLSQPFAYNPVLQFSESEGVLTVSAQIIELYGNVSLSATLRVNGGAAVPMTLSADGKTFSLTDAAFAKTGFYEAEISATLGSYSSTSYARWSDERYLAADGSDANHGFSADSPFATVAAVKASILGDTKRVLIGAGEHQFEEEWTVDIPLLISAYPGVPREDVILKGRGEAGGFRLFTIDHADAELRGVTVSGGSTTVGWADGGGGIKLKEGTVNGCVISNCSAPKTYACGGGIFAANTTSCVVTNTLFQGNSCHGVGGLFRGIAYDCQFVENTQTGASNTGDGTSGGASHSILWRCTFENNNNTSKAYSSSANNVTAYDCLFVGGNGKYAAGGTFYNCTFTGNTSTSGAISGTAYNTISWGNTGGNYADGAKLYYCCTTPAQESWAEAQVGEAGYGCTDGDPRLKDDYTPGKRSSAINAGCNDYVASSVDLSGISSRIIGKIVDMGCYESPKVPGLIMFVR